MAPLAVHRPLLFRHERGATVDCETPPLILRKTRPSAPILQASTRAILGGNTVTLPTHTLPVAHGDSLGGLHRPLEPVVPLIPPGQALLAHAKEHQLPLQRVHTLQQDWKCPMSSKLVPTQQQHPPLPAQYPHIQHPTQQQRDWSAFLPQFRSISTYRALQAAELSRSSTRTYRISSKTLSEALESSDTELPSRRLPVGDVSTESWTSKLQPQLNFLSGATNVTATPPAAPASANFPLKSTVVAGYPAVSHLVPSLVPQCPVTDPNGCQKQQQGAEASFWQARLLQQQQLLQQHGDILHQDRERQRQQLARIIPHLLTKPVLHHDDDSTMMHCSQQEKHVQQPALQQAQLPLQQPVLLPSLPLREQQEKEQPKDDQQLVSQQPAEEQQPTELLEEQQAHCQRQLLHDHENMQQQQLEPANEESNKQKRLAEQLQIVEQQLAEKEALLALFDGALEKQQKLQVDEQLQHLQEQQEGLQKLLVLVEQQKQELAEQRLEVEAQQREVEQALLKQQEQQDILWQHQKDQHAAADEQQQQHQWFKEQQAAFLKARAELEAEQQKQLLQQQRLAELQSSLQQQEADLARQQQQQEQQKQQLLDQTRQVQSSLRLQGVQLLQQHQALQRQLQQQRELQQQIIEYQRQQLRESEEIFLHKRQQQQQQNQERQRLTAQQQHLLLQHSSRPRTQLGTLGDGYFPTQQHLQLSSLQKNLLSQLHPKRRYEEAKSAQWGSCDMEGTFKDPTGLFKATGGFQCLEEKDLQRKASCELMHVPAVDWQGKGGTGRQRSPRPVVGLSMSHSEALDELPSRLGSARGRSEGRRGTVRLNADGPGSPHPPSRSQAGPWQNKSGGPRRSASIPASSSTCPPRLLRSTESQRLREKSLQEHLRVLQATKKRPPGCSRGMPKRGLEGPSMSSSESMRSVVSPVRSRGVSQGCSANCPQPAAGGLATRETSKDSSSCANSHWSGSRRGSDPQVSGVGAVLSEPTLQQALSEHRGGPMTTPWQRQQAFGEGAPRGASSLGTKQQQQLHQLLLEQRKEISLLLMEKQQLEREASGGGLSGRDWGGAFPPRGRSQPRAFPKEPYVRNSRECEAPEGEQVLPILVPWFRLTHLRPVLSVPFCIPLPAFLRLVQEGHLAVYVGGTIRGQHGGL